MSITSDLRAYADSAVHQGKQTLSTAQAQFSGVTEQAGEIVNKFAGSVVDGARGNVSDIADRAHEAVTDLRASTEKLVDVDALRASLEPYVAQLRGYGDSLSDRVEELVGTLKGDPRFSKLFETADSVSAVIIDLVQEHVVKPARSLTGSRGTPAPSAKPATKASTKPATTRPASPKPASPKPARKTTARTAPAKGTSTTS